MEMNGVTSVAKAVNDLIIQASVILAGAGEN